MSNSCCNGSDCANKIAEYKNGIDKLLKRLRDSENLKSEYEIANLTLKQKLNRPSKTESKNFQRMFTLIQSLIENYFGKSKKDDSIRDIFLGMIDSIWSLLAARYSDIDSWLDLKYLGTNLVENLANLELPSSLDNSRNNSTSEHVYETLSDLKKGNELNKLLFSNEENDQFEFNKFNFTELNKELECMKKETNILHEKIQDQNGFIKNLIKLYAQKEAKLYSQIDNLQQKHNVTNLNTTANTTSSSVRLSECSNDISSGSFNLNTSQGTTNNTLSSSCPKLNDKYIDGRGVIRSPLSMTNREGTTFVCPTCKVPVDSRRCSVEKFEKHVAACKNSSTNVHLKNERNNKNETSTHCKYSGSSFSGSSNSSTPPNSGTPPNRRSSDSSNGKNYIVINNFEPKPRKRL